MIDGRLRALRLCRGMSQAQLAKIVSASQESICHYENGKSRPSYSVLMELARAFDVTTDYLLGMTERKTPPSAFGALRDTQEQELIENFRNLCPNEKQRVIGYARDTKDKQNA